MKDYKVGERLNQFDTKTKSRRKTIKTEKIDWKQLGQN